MQGPYQLTGLNGERDIIVLAGTEKVFLDGIEMIRGENNDYNTSYRDGRWQCTCSFFSSWGMCSHTMAMERILADMLPPEAISTQYDISGE